jgi:hypothetical protein
MRSVKTSFALGTAMLLAGVVFHTAAFSFDGGKPLPYPPKVVIADGGKPLPYPPKVLAFDGGKPLPYPPSSQAAG